MFSWLESRLVWQAGNLFLATMLLFRTVLGATFSFANNALYIHDHIGPIKFVSQSLLGATFGMMWCNWRMIRQHRDPLLKQIRYKVLDCVMNCGLLYDKPLKLTLSLLLAVQNWADLMRWYGF